MRRLGLLALTVLTLGIWLTPIVPSGKTICAITDHANIAMAPTIPASRMRMVMASPLKFSDRPESQA